MSTRGAGFGLDAELARKSALKYDPQKESEAREYIPPMSGRSGNTPELPHWM